MSKEHKLQETIEHLEAEIDQMREKLDAAEVIMAGDPDNKFPQYREMWRRAAINYADKLEKIIAFLYENETIKVTMDAGLPIEWREIVQRIVNDRGVLE